MAMPKQQSAHNNNGRKAVNHYLSYRDSLVGLVLVMDIRHPNQPFDEDMLNWAKESELPIHILLNKADKLGRNAQQQALVIRPRANHLQHRCSVFQPPRVRVRRSCWRCYSNGWPHPGKHRVTRNMFSGLRPSLRPRRSLL